MSGMTSAERLELGKLVRLKAKVAKDEAEARGKWLLADAEAKLAACYKADDEVWEDITEAAEKAVKEADATLAAICRLRGIPEEFRPGLHLSWYQRGENAMAQRRAELRKVAQTEITARVAQAKVEIDRQAAQQLTEITRAGLTSEEAMAFIDQMPTPEALLPPINALELDGKVVQLLVTPVTAPAVTVTDPVMPSVTDSRYKCHFCGEAFTPTRRDSKYCKPTCRVAGFRRRHVKGSESR
jgi:hypothetical protein